MAIFSKLAKGHAKEINKAQKWIDSAQATFASAIEEAQIAEEKFDAVVTDAQSKINDLQKIVDETEAKKQQAVNFKKKINTFMEE